MLTLKEKISMGKIFEENSCESKIVTKHLKLTEKYNNNIIILKKLNKIFKKNYDIRIKNKKDIKKLKKVIEKSVEKKMKEKSNNISRPYQIHRKNSKETI